MQLIETIVAKFEMPDVDLWSTRRDLLFQSNSDFFMGTTRRQFLESLPLIAEILGFPTLLRAFELNSRLQNACIGVGGVMGNTDFKSFLSRSRTDIIALCAKRSERCSVPDLSRRLEGRGPWLMGNGATILTQAHRITSPLLDRRPRAVP